MIHSQKWVRAKEAEDGGGGGWHDGEGRRCGGSQMSNLIKEVVHNIANELEKMCDKRG